MLPMISRGTAEENIKQQWYGNYSVPFGLLSDDRYITRVFAITGPDTAFGDGLKHRPKNLYSIPPDTILAVQVHNSQTHWLQPGDFDIRHPPKMGIDSGDVRTIGGEDGVFVVVFADGPAWVLVNETPLEALMPLFTVTGAETSTRDVLLGRYRYNFTFGSSNLPDSAHNWWVKGKAEYDKSN